MIRLLETDLIKSTLFVHYGDSDFDLSQVRPVTHFQNHYNKPKIGGLWFSPKDSKWGWENWCKETGYSLFSKKYTWECRLSEESKIIKISRNRDINELPTKELFIEKLGDVCWYIDYDELQRLGYDGLFLSSEAVSDFPDEYPFGDPRPTFRFWDCESLLLFNLECIEKIISYESRV